MDFNLDYSSQVSSFTDQYTEAVNKFNTYKDDLTSAAAALTEKGKNIEEIGGATAAAIYKGLGKVKIGEGEDAVTLPQYGQNFVKQAGKDLVQNVRNRLSGTQRAAAPEGEGNRPLTEVSEDDYTPLARGTAGGTQNEILEGDPEEDLVGEVAEGAAAEGGAAAAEGGAAAGATAAAVEGGAAAGAAAGGGAAAGVGAAIELGALGTVGAVASAAIPILGGLVAFGLGIRDLIVGHKHTEEDNEKRFKFNPGSADLPSYTPGLT